MGEITGELSADAKLVRLVLDNCGPLSPPEAAREAYLYDQQARDALSELEAIGLVEPVCGMCASREEVFALTEAGEAMEAGD